MSTSFASAPPVAFRSGPTPLLKGLLLLLWCAGSATVATAVAWGGLTAAATGVLLLLLLASAASSHLFWRAQTPRVLLWDGGRWLLTQPGHAPDARRDVVRLDVAFDVQRAILLCCHGVGPSAHRRWLWLQRAGDGARWHALRCALYVATRDD